MMPCIYAQVDQVCICMVPWAAWPHGCTDRVPNLQLYLLPVDVDHAGTELDANSEVMHRLEPLVGELEKQA